MAEEDLTDVWSIILRECATDDRRDLRNMTVPALAHVATYRALCREVRDGAARLVTPYDATIRFAPNGLTRVPVAFCGGVHFAEHRFGPGLSIIRDRATSQMFAVSHSTAEHHSGWLGDGGVESCWVYQVNRMYPLARLAQLLGGHASVWSQRLPDLLQVALPPRESDVGGAFYAQTRVVMRSNSLTPQQLLHRGVVAKNQLRAREWNGEEGSFTVHHDDFITHKVVNLWQGGYRSYMKDTDFVMVECVEGGRVNAVALFPKRHNWCGNDHGKLGIRSPSVFAVSPGDDGVHGLSRAFGWDCAPRVAEGPGWLVSMFTHKDSAFIQAMPARHVPAEDLMHLCALAREARDAEDQARAEPYHPIHNPTGFDLRVRARRRPRPKRAAAQVALERMYEQGGERPYVESSSSAESDGSGDDDAAEPPPPPPPPPPPRPEPSLAELDARLRVVWDAMKRGDLGRLLDHKPRLRVV